MKKKFNALIVGFGYWGPILARNFQNSSQFEVYAVCDSNNPNLNRGKNIYPNSVYYKSYKTALNDPNIDIVIISSPTTSKQNPKTSKPHETLATVAGEKILIESITNFFQSLLYLQKFPLQLLLLQLQLP